MLVSARLSALGLEITANFSTQSLAEASCICNWQLHVCHTGRIGLTTMVDCICWCQENDIHFQEVQQSNPLDSERLSSTEMFFLITVLCAAYTAAAVPA